MYERFTDRARRAVVLAEQQARSLDHNYLGTEHLLLGLLAEGSGVGAQALNRLGADAETIKRLVLDRVPGGGTAPSGHIPFTPRAKRVLELSLQEALALGHNYIGTEHILLGLLREAEGIGSQVLGTLGIDLDAARSKVVELLVGVAAGTTSPAREHSTPQPTQARQSPALRTALAQATALAGNDLVGTHHMLAALATTPDAAAPQILAVGGFDSSSLPMDITAWEVRGTGDEDPVERAARATVLTQDASGLTIRLEDDTLQERIARAISAGHLSEDQLRDALGRVWAQFAEAGGPTNEGDATPTPEAPGQD
jgi:ATP-dependent Clp protease ATP-binding subunit ClpA